MNHKIVFAGHPGSGKTRAIRSVSDSFVVGTEAKAQGRESLGKDETTVAMDYGIIHLNSRERVHLYGTPGQERFSFMWPILAKNSLGLLLLVDNSRDTSIAELGFYLEQFSYFALDGAIAVGVSHCDIGPPIKTEEYSRLFKKRNINPPILEVDTRVADDVRKLLRALLLSTRYKKRGGLYAD